jgi:glycosyltransferase involved in cell wall biosynthesis
MLVLGQALIEQHNKVDLVYIEGTSEAVSMVPKGISLCHISSAFMPFALLSLTRYLRERKPAVLLSAVTSANLIAVCARRMAGVSTRVVVSEHLYMSRNIQSHWMKRGLPWLAACLYPSADGIVTVSNGVADDLAKQGKLPRDHIKVIHNPVVTTSLYESAQTCPEHPWLKENVPIILGVGRLVPQKNFSVLIRAFGQIAREKTARLIILGEGEERSYLEALVAELGLQSIVSLPGFTDNPFAYMKRSAVFVLSSRYEGFGNVLVEAMACGCPIVSTDCPAGPAEILDNGRYGKLVPVGDVTAMANAVLEVMAAPPCEDNLQERARHFAVENILDEYMRVLFASNQVR